MIISAGGDWSFLSCTDGAIRYTRRHPTVICPFVLSEGAGCWQMHIGRPAEKMKTGEPFQSDPAYQTCKGKNSFVLITFSFHKATFNGEDLIEESPLKREEEEEEGGVAFRWLARAR